MDRSDTTLPTFDPRVLQDLDGPDGPGDGQLGPRVAKTFTTSTATLCAGLKDAIAADDAAALADAAHSLKSSAAQVGAMRLSSLARELERTAATEGAGAAHELTDQILRESDRVRQAMRDAGLG